MDTAILTVENAMKAPITMFYQTDVCDNCSLIDVGTIPYNCSLQTTLNTNWPVHVEFHSHIEGKLVILCNRTLRYREYSKYVYYITPNMTNFVSEYYARCHLVNTNSEEWDSLTPLYIFFGIICGVGLLGALFSCLWKQRICRRIRFLFQKDAEMAEDLGSPDLDSSTGHDDHSMVNSIVDKSVDVDTQGRLRSLDVFRGLALVLMIFVNYGGGGYWFMKHSTWNGLTVADLVFPWFIFVMGTAMAISFKRMHRGDVSKKTMLAKTIFRSLTLFCLGIMLNSVKCKGNLTHLRIPGVLQRFAVTYLVIALMEMAFCRYRIGKSGTEYSGSELTEDWRPSPLSDLAKLWPHAIVAAGLISIYLGLSFGLNIGENCKAGYLGPGGLHDNSNWFNCTGGAAAYVDRKIFGDHHIYQTPSCRKIYKSIMPHDPEGLLGCATSILLCLFGLLSGKIFLIYKHWTQCVKRFIIWALITLSIGLLLCEVSWNDGWIPINKNLWSLSFVLVNAAGSFLIIGFLYFVVDVLNIWSGFPFFYPGMNSIFIYVCHEVFAKYFPVFFKVPDTHASQLSLNIWGTVFWIIVSYCMYKKKIFISI